MNNHWKLCHAAAKRLEQGKTSRPNQTANTYFKHLKAAIRGEDGDNKA